MWCTLKAEAIAGVVFIVLSLAPGALLAANEFPRVGVNALAAGALSQTDLGFGMLEARATLSRHLFIGAGPAVLAPEGRHTDYQLRAAATLLLRVGPVQLDDRNLWVFSDAGTTRYRNRLRVTAPVHVGGRTLRFQLFDEVYHQQGGPGWFRNVIAGGAGIDVNPAFSADAYWMLHQDDSRPQYSMFLLLLTMRLR